MCWLYKAVVLFILKHILLYLSGAKDDVLFIAMAGTHQIWMYFFEDAKWIKNRYMFFSDGSCFKEATCIYPHIFKSLDAKVTNRTRCVFVCSRIQSVYVCFPVTTWRERARASPEVDRRRTGTTTIRTEQRSRSRPASHWVSEASHAQ